VVGRAGAWKGWRPELGGDDGGYGFTGYTVGVGGGD
jgi:hypothetical protein